jgi:hypothetical protein
VPSLGDLIDEVIATLHGHSTDVPAMGTLVGPIDADSTELAIDFGDQPGASRPNGIVEIGSELIQVTRFDQSNGVATVPGWGRGQRGTVAQTHPAGVSITVRPRYPRVHVARAINQVVAASCPPLFAPRDLPPIETGAFVSLGYTLPQDTVRVLRVEVTPTDVPEYIAHRRVDRNWTVRNVAGTQLLELDRCETHQTVQVTIAAEPGVLVSEADDFTVTGLSAAAADMVVFGALARLVLGIDLARQQVTSVEASARSDRIGVSSGTTISRYYQALYTQRLEAERDRLQSLYPLTLLRRG